VIYISSRPVSVMRRCCDLGGSSTCRNALNQSSWTVRNIVSC